MRFTWKEITATTTLQFGSDVPQLTQVKYKQLVLVR